MPDHNYSVLYTHQKVKKVKSWQEGTLSLHLTQISCKVVLKSDKLQVVDSAFIPPRELQPGEEIELEKHIVMIETVLGNPSTQATISTPLVTALPTPPPPKRRLFRPPLLKTQPAMTVVDSRSEVKHPRFAPPQPRPLFASPLFTGFNFQQSSAKSHVRLDDNSDKANSPLQEPRSNEELLSLLRGSVNSSSPPTSQGTSLLTSRDESLRSSLLSSQAFAFVPSQSPAVRQLEFDDSASKSNDQHEDNLNSSTARKRPLWDTLDEQELDDHQPSTKQRLHQLNEEEDADLLQTDSILPVHDATVDLSEAVSDQLDLVSTQDANDRSMLLFAHNRAAVPSDHRPSSPRLNKRATSVSTPSGRPWRPPTSSSSKSTAFAQEVYDLEGIALRSAASDTNTRPSQSGSKWTPSFSPSKQRWYPGSLNDQDSLFKTIKTPGLSHGYTGGLLIFPSEEACTSMDKTVKRTSSLPTEFDSLNEYQTKFSNALHENLQVQITQLALNYRAICVEWLGKNQTSPAEKEKFFRFRSVNLYLNCKLEVQTQRWRSTGEGTLYQLHLQRKQHSSLYAKDDLWLISSDDKFSSETTMIGLSTFFGPNASGHLDLCLLFASQSRIADHLCRLTSVVAIHIADAASDLLMQETLMNDVGRMPLLEEILKPSHYVKEAVHRSNLHGPSIALLSYEQVIKVAEEITQKYHLNFDQDRVLHSFALGFVSPSSLAQAGLTTQSGITLVHGVFGAGKSFLLAVLIVFMSRLRSLLPENRAKNFRVLVSSATNVAVDRVLRSLMQLDFHDFVRVGSLKKIAKAILPFVANGRNSDDQRELQAMLKANDISKEDEGYIRRTLEKLKKNDTKNAISKALVVGVTCSASTFPILSGLTFPVVLLDECSQMIEPMSLVPVARFDCVRLMLIGDPQQLSPTIPSDSLHSNGLDRTLFERLRDAGHATILLATQYRCHPVISAVCNDLFYRGRLQDGVSAEDRRPLIDGLKSLVCVDVSSGIERFFGNSCFNTEEVDVMVAIVRHLLRLEVSPESIDKTQTSRVKEKLSASADGASVQVSTVDAFQGAEKEIVLVSCVRTRFQQHDFIDSHRRINVAISRAKRHLIVVGHADMLSHNATWNRVMQHCREHGSVRDHEAFLFEAQEWIKNDINNPSS